MKVRTFQKKGAVRSRVEQKSFTETVLSKTKDPSAVSSSMGCCVKARFKEV